MKRSIMIKETELPPVGYTIPEVQAILSQLLGYKPTSKYAYKLIERKQLNPVRSVDGRHMRVSREELYSFLKQRENE